MKTFLALLNDCALLVVLVMILAVLIIVGTL